LDVRAGARAKNFDVWSWILKFESWLNSPDNDWMLFIRCRRKRAFTHAVVALTGFVLLCFNIV